MSTPIQNATQQFTSQTTPFGLKTLLDTYKETTAIAINCHHIGTIQTFDASNQTATASVNYSKTYFQYNPQTNDTSPVQIDYPILMSCPVICLGGGASSLTFPIQSGDECLILFNDRSLDNWFQNGAGSPVNSPRLHSISDGIILVGLRSSQKVLSGYSSTHAVLQNGTTQVGVGSSTINIANMLTSLGSILQNLISAIETATYGGSTIDSTAALETVRTLVGELLE